MSFGPVSGEGGERRLNVLFTRARSRCEIFCSFSAGDIDPDRAKGEGARILKRFLQYAETGILEERVSISEDADSPFEEAVAAVIESLGYIVDKQVGSAGFKIDLAVRHSDEPGRYMLAVECDGATYHRALCARERDRLRQEVLENMGWRFHRIWSTDWFYRRGEAVEKLRAALNEARSAKPVQTMRQESQAQETASERRPANRPPADAMQPMRIPEYRLAQCSVPNGIEPHQVPVEAMARITKVIVEAEGPIHQDEVARRVSALFGKQRTGSQISQSSLSSLLWHKKRADLVEEEGFWMTAEQFANPPVRDRTSAPTTLQKAETLSPREIRAAATILTGQNGSLTEEEMVIAVARLFGFKRTGPDLKVAISAALKEPVDA